MTGSWIGDISHVHTWVSKPFPIRITLIRMTSEDIARAKVQTLLS